MMGAPVAATPAYAGSGYVGRPRPAADVERVDSVPRTAAGGASYRRGMDTAELLTDHFTRIRELYGALARGLDANSLNHRPADTGNSMAWLLWHVARLQDDHIAHLAGVEQRWGEWQERFGLDNGVDDVGYGHTSEQVDAVRVTEPTLLIAYHADVHDMTLGYLPGVDGDELDRVIDTRWDPPVTAGVRLVSLVGDCLQHLGQVGYVKGLLGF